MKSSTVVSRVLGCLTVLFMFGSESAMAHPGHGAPGLESGALHPLMGLDHLLAMVAVGLWAYQLGGRAIWMVPLSFVSVMIAGGMLGMNGGSLAGVEQMILASVFVVGLLIASAVRLPVWTAALVAGGFAFFHGFAHGTEMPGGTSAILFAAGFALSTIALHAIGAALGFSSEKAIRSVLVRTLGAAIAASAAVLSVA